jgi:hypothetical protein
MGSKFLKQHRENLMKLSAELGYRRVSVNDCRDGITSELINSAFNLKVNEKHFNPDYIIENSTRQGIGLNCGLYIQYNRHSFYINNTLSSISSQYKLDKTRSNT